MIRDIIYLFWLITEITLEGLRTIILDKETVNNMHFNSNKRKSKNDIEKISFIESLNRQCDLAEPQEYPRPNIDGSDG